MGQFSTRDLATEQDPAEPRSVVGALTTGVLLQDRYQIIDSLGLGGFSSVYRARDMRFPSVEKFCAIKEMMIHTADPQLRSHTIQSFEREASMLAVLNHPAIPDISDYFTEGDRSYLVLELIEGRDLQQWINSTTDQIDETKAIDWALQICDALAYLHGQKPRAVVFRDLKPSNIMLDNENRLHLIDFGIAKMFEADQDRGTMIGTEGYTPPEQYRGEASPAGDIYALGATLHHIMTRRDPRLETPFTFDERPIHDFNPNVSAEFTQIVMRCLAYDPKERYPDAMALREALYISEPDDDPGESETRRGASDVVIMPAVQVGTGQVQPLWIFTCEDEIRARAAFSRGIVFAAAYDHNLYAVTANQGEFLWKYPTRGSIGAAPTVNEDAVYVASADGYIYSLGLRNGNENWRFAAQGSIYSSPTVRYDHAFFGSDDGYFYALNAYRGSLSWRANAYSGVRSSPFVSEEQAVFGTEDGEIFSLELATGEVRWQSKAQHAVTSSPAMADDIVVVGSRDGAVYAFDASSGWLIWRFRTQRPIVSSPVIHQDVAYIGSADGNMYAIELETGRRLWAYQTEGQIASSPVVWQGAVYFGSADGNIYGLSQKRGDLQWRFEAKCLIIAAPLIVEGVMYVGGANHQLFALPV